MNRFFKKLRDLAVGTAALIGVTLATKESIERDVEQRKVDKARTLKEASTE